MNASESTGIPGPLMSEEEWHSLTRTVTEMVKSIGVLQFPNHEGDLACYNVVQVAKKDDLFSFYDVLSTMIRQQQIPANDVQWKGILAMAAACSSHNGEARTLAKQVYLQEPRYGMAYGAMAHICYTSNQSFEADRWLKLVELCQDSNSDNWYKTLRGNVNFEMENSTYSENALTARHMFASHTVLLAETMEFDFIIVFR